MSRVSLVAARSVLGLQAWCFHGASIYTTQPTLPKRLMLGYARIVFVGCSSALKGFQRSGSSLGFGAASSVTNSRDSHGISGLLSGILWGRWGFI